MIRKTVKVRITIKRYVCQGCGLGLNAGTVSPENKKNEHWYVMGIGTAWWCGPVVNIPQFPRFVKATDKWTGVTYYVSMNSKGERLRRQVGIKGARWENIDALQKVTHVVEATAGSHTITEFMRKVDLKAMRKAGAIREVKRKR